MGEVAVVASLLGACGFAADEAEIERLAAVLPVLQLAASAVGAVGAGHVGALQVGCPGASEGSTDHTTPGSEDLGTFT